VIDKYFVKPDGTNNFEQPSIKWTSKRTYIGLRK
jgi:hypothetical protein